MSDEDKKEESTENVERSTEKETPVVDGSKKEKPLGLEERCAQYELGWKRALADYENLKRSMAEQQSTSRRRIKADFAQSMLPVMDNFAQAVKHAPEADGGLGNWLQGVLYIEKQFNEAFSEFGLERIETIGSAFDPHLHEAAGEKEGKEGEILEEVTSGWKMGEDVLRPARVIVGKSE